MDKDVGIGRVKGKKWGSSKTMTTQRLFPGKSNRKNCFVRCYCPLSIDLIGYLGVVPNSNLSGLKFFVCCICIRMWHSHLNDMEMSETKRFIPKGFELGTTLSYENLVYQQS